MDNKAPVIAALISGITIGLAASAIIAPVLVWLMSSRVESVEAPRTRGPEIVDPNGLSEEECREALQAANDELVRSRKQMADAGIVSVEWPERIDLHYREPEVRRLLESTGVERHLYDLDCTEYPCIVVFVGPNDPIESAKLRRPFFDHYRDANVDTHGVGIGRDTTYTISTLASPDVEPDEARTKWRMESWREKIQSKPRLPFGR